MTMRPQALPQTVSSPSFLEKAGYLDSQLESQTCTSFQRQLDAQLLDLALQPEPGYPFKYPKELLPGDSCQGLSLDSSQAKVKSAIYTVQKTDSGTSTCQPWVLQPGSVKSAVIYDLGLAPLTSQGVLQSRSASVKECFSQGVLQSRRAWLKEDLKIGLARIAVEYKHMLRYKNLNVRAVKQLLENAEVRNSKFGIMQFQKFFEDKSAIWHCQFDAGKLTAMCVLKKHFPAKGYVYVNEIQAFVSGKKYGKKMLERLLRDNKSVWLAERAGQAKTLHKFYKTVRGLKELPICAKKLKTCLFCKHCDADVLKAAYAS